MYAILGSSGYLKFPDGADLQLERDSIVSILNGHEHYLLDDQRPIARNELVPFTFDDLDEIDLERPRKKSCTRILMGRIPIASNPLPEVLPSAIYVPPKMQDTCGRLFDVLKIASRFHSAPANVRQPVFKRIAEILAIELTEFSLRSSKVSWGSRISDPRIRRTIELIRVHPERPWSLISLAAEARMSRSAFSARFRDVVGQTPVKYLQSIRMQCASELIQNTSIPLYEIAYSVGYSSDTAFSRAFQRHFEVSPALYRKQWSTVRA